jgi:hypothetical protein
MSRLALMTLCLALLAGCALGPQPSLDAPRKPLAARQADAVECQALAAQAAAGAEVWSRNPAMRAALTDNAREQYLAKCLQGRGWIWQPPVTQEREPTP